jgi:hypothetical protein
LSANVTLNGKRLEGKVVPMRPGFLASEVKGYLDQHKDGFDSYKVSVGGRDFLILGKGYKDLKASDNLAIDGQRAQVDFLEQEANTAGEGAAKSLFSLGGLGKAAIGAVAGLAGGFGALMVFGGEAIIFTGLAIPAAIGLGAALLLTAGAGALGGAFKRTDESVANALSSGPPGTLLPKASGPVPPAVPGERPAPPKVDPDPKK